MSFLDLVLRGRSYRRFDETRPITKEQLSYLVNLARQTPSGGNRQSLKYISVSAETKEGAVLCGEINSQLAWAAYLTEWTGPSKGERPTGFIIMLRDTSIFKTPAIDEGIAAQTIMLGAAEKGLGACFIGSFKKEPLLNLFKLTDERFEIALVIAIGYPAEKILLENLGTNGDTDSKTAHKYYRDKDGVHHVPKRSLSEVLIQEI